MAPCQNFAPRLHVQIWWDQDQGEDEGFVFSIGIIQKQVACNPADMALRLKGSNLFHYSYPDSGIMH